ncbi:MAG TPA: formate/nitrite transporter family protein [Actinobacteria bacterium]|nr:formate/nitrite transporter family protein [Actinomycetota bacterium]
MSNKGPIDIAREIVEIGKKKAHLPASSTAILSILAGIYIAIAGQAMITVTHDAAGSVGTGLARLLGGSVFSLGLILVVLAGAELFTGNSLMVVGWLERKLNLKALAKNWSIVYIGNLIGSILIVYLVFFSGIWMINGGAVGKYALSIAVSKANLGFWSALVRGIGANWLVCVAIWLSISGRTTRDKILGIYFPITAFVLLGFEHSIANMFFLPMGLLLKGALSVPGASSLTLSTAIFNNIIPVTIGNIIGGVLFVAVPYWMVYLKNHNKQQVLLKPELVKRAA